jgi:hypothetical protein
MRKSKGTACGAALSVGLVATVLKGRAAKSAPTFTFTGRPLGGSSVAVSVLRGVGALTDLLGVDFGTQIAPLIAADHPPSFTVSGLHVQRDQVGSVGGVCVIRTGSPSGK